MKELFTKLRKDFQEIVNNKQLLQTATEQFLNNLIDELTLGIIFDTHRKAKTKAFDLDDEEGLELERGSDIEIFSQYNVKKTPDCVCPYCDRALAATRFAPHLEKCMVEGKSRQKNAARKVAANTSKELENSYRDSGVSDNEDDADWSPGNKRRMKKKEKNSRKRSKGTTKKSVDLEYVDTLNVDASNQSGSSGGRKRERSKSNKNRRDRSSPCSSTSSLN